MAAAGKTGHSTNFTSVKLPEFLVQQAKAAAQPLCRSAGRQIEYWATLGRVVEHSRLTAQEARHVIENYEVAAREAQTKTEMVAVAAVPDCLEFVKRRRSGCQRRR